MHDLRRAHGSIKRPTNQLSATRVRGSTRSPRRARRRDWARFPRPARPWSAARSAARSQRPTSSRVRAASSAAWLVRRFLGCRARGLEARAAPTTETAALQLFGGFSPILAELDPPQAGSIKSHRDLARWQDADWQSLFAKTGVPPGGPGDTPAAKTAAYATGVAAVVRAAFPTEFLRGKAAQPIQPLSLRFLPALAAANPTLDLRQSLPGAPNWGSIAGADQPAARAEWEAFRGEARAFRATPARTLLTATVAGNGVNPLRSTANQTLLAAADPISRTCRSTSTSPRTRPCSRAWRPTRSRQSSATSERQRVVRIVDAQSRHFVPPRRRLGAAHRADAARPLRRPLQRRLGGAGAADKAHDRNGSRRRRGLR